MARRQGKAWWSRLGEIEPLGASYCLDILLFGAETASIGFRRRLIRLRRLAFARYLALNASAGRPCKAFPYICKGFPYMRGGVGVRL